MVFFFHNPKAAGTSINTFLRRHFGEDNVCPIIENNHVDHSNMAGEYGAFRDYRVYAGHYGRNIYDAIGGDMRAITNFRRPADRILSLYNYFKYTVQVEDFTDGRHLAIQAAKSLSFDDFVMSDDPEVEVYVRNHHYRQLSWSGWDLRITRTMIDVEASIDEMAWYYVCEYPEYSEMWGKSAFRTPELNLARENSFPGKFTGGAADNLSRRILKIIEDKNSLDLGIYEYAVNRLHDHVPARPRARAI